MALLLLSKSNYQLFWVSKCVFSGNENGYLVRHYELEQAWTFLFSRNKKNEGK